MTSTSTSHVSPAHYDPTRRRKPAVDSFRAPPLRLPVDLDVHRDLASVRHRRTLLSQRIGAALRRGHARD